MTGLLGHQLEGQQSSSEAFGLGPQSKVIPEGNARAKKYVTCITFYFNKRIFIYLMQINFLLKHIVSNIFRFTSLLKGVRQCGRASISMSLAQKTFRYYIVNLIIIRLLNKQK